MYVSYGIFSQLSDGGLKTEIGGCEHGEKRVFLLKSNMAAKFKMAASFFLTSNESPNCPLYSNVSFTWSFMAN